MKRTLIALFEKSANKYSDNVLMLEKRKDKYEPTTYRQTKKFVYDFSAGLISLGLKKGERVALISEGRNDWVISELAILYAGAVNVPISVKVNELEPLYRQNVKPYFKLVKMLKIV